MENSAQIFLLVGMMMLIGGATAYFAEQRGRSPFVWFCVGFFFGILGFLSLFLFPNLASSRTEEREQPPKEMLDTPPTSPNNRPIDKEWFFLNKEGIQEGPVSTEHLKKLQQQNFIDDDVYVWSEGMSDWKRIHQLPILKRALID